MALPTDTAVKGRNAQMCTAARHTELELDALDGKVSVLVLWDGTQFFDRLEAPQTAKCALSTEFPVVPLTMGMMQHRGPRLLTADKQVSDIVQATASSVLPGCISARWCASISCMVVSASLPQ